MSQSANDWASLDPSKNMTLAEADQLKNEVAGGFAIQFGDRYIKTQFGAIISEAELRANNYMSPLAVNLYGRLAIPGSQEFNIADFRASLRKAAASSDPIWGLVAVLQQVVPTGINVPNMLTRIPAVQTVIASALKTI